MCHCGGFDFVMTKKSHWVKITRNSFFGVMESSNCSELCYKLCLIISEDCKIPLVIYGFTCTKSNHVLYSKINFSSKKTI